MPHAKPSRRCPGAPFLLLALASVGVACAQEGEADLDRAPNVILVCLDTLRADHLGCYGYERRPTTPFLDSLAAESLQFVDTSATACWTKPSVPSILTGTLPMQHGVYRGSARDEAGSFSDVLPQEAVPLAEVFGDSGYQTAAFVKNSQLRAGMGFEQGFEIYRDQAGDAREIRWRATDWLDARDPQKPFFLYLHMLDAHWPYPVPDAYALLFTEMEIAQRIRSGDWRALRAAVNNGKKEMSAEDLEALIALYDGAIRYMDDQLALLWQKLEREGTADNTILCVLADHGEEFLEHGRLGHGHGLYENLLAVPWILHRPGRKPRRIETPVSLLDVFPTLLASAGISPSGDMLPGINRLVAVQASPPLLSEHLEPGRYHIAWREGAEKLVETVKPRRASRKSAPGLADINPHGRWEARLARDSSGGMRVLRLRPAKDQKETEIEVKGPIEDLAANHLILAGLVIDISNEPELYGALQGPEGSEQELCVGLLVKARGSLHDGRLVARKLKLYGASDEVEIEVRGPLAVSGNEQIEIGGIALAVDGETVFDTGVGASDLGPLDVAAIVAGEMQIKERAVQRFLLASDAQELAPKNTTEAVLGDPRRRAILAAWLKTRIWGEGSARRLSEDELDDLRAIGYAE